MRYGFVATALGTVAVGFDAHGVTRIVLPETDWKEPTKAQLQRAGFKQREPLPAAFDLSRRDVPLSTAGVTPFTLHVLRTAQRIPAGETRTYGELAKMAGSPAAARAVGTAMATNRWPIVVPCHRVFASNGFGEYSAGQGVATKLRLLWQEGYRGPTSNLGYALQAREHLLTTELAGIVERAGPFTLQATAPRPRSSASPFVALARSIVFQQLTGKAAATIYARVESTLREVSPAAVLRTPKAKLRAAGLSENKALSLIDLAKRAGDLPTRSQMEAMSDEQLLQVMSSVRGIGRWSGQMLLMFYLGRPDVLPLLDLGVRKGFARMRGEETLPSDAELEKAARAWAPFRSVASWYLWRATELP